MIYFGIDFGTSNSCIAYYNAQTGEKGVIKPRIEEAALRGGNVVPTVVALNSEGHLFASGYFAMACGEMMGSIVVNRVKQWIGRPFREVIQDDRLQNLAYTLVPSDDGVPLVEKGNYKYTAENIVSYFLKFLIGEAYTSLKEKYNFSEEDAGLIVTYPAYYLQNQVDAIRDAVNLVVKSVNNETKKSSQGPNITFVKLIPEPLATICAAISDEKIDEKDKYVLVIDEGAGTLDVMLVNIGNSSIDQLKSGSNPVIEASGVTIGGMERLGGVDMDNSIYDWIRIELLHDGFDINTLNQIDMKKLMRDIEDAKISISSGKASEAQIGIPKFSQVKRLSEDQMNLLIKDTIESCKSSVEKAIKDIETKQEGFKKSDISKVLLIGGPTQMQLFKNKMYEAIQVIPIEGINPMEYVAIGAAVSPSVKYKVPVERTYGLIHKQGEIEEFQRIIEKDSALPIGVIKSYNVDKFDNKIIIEVAQIYQENASEIECRKMGRYEYHIPPKKATYAIIFSIDEERKVDIAITESESKAIEYKDGNNRDDIFHLQFFRETDQLPCIISKHSDEGGSIDPVIKEALHKNAPTLFRYLANGYEQIKICEKVLEYDLEKDKRTRLEDLKNEISVLADTIFMAISRIVEMVELDEGMVTPESINAIKKEEKEIRESGDFIELVKKISFLKHEFEDIRDEIKYGKESIRELVERISIAETKAIEVIKRRQNVVSDQQKIEIGRMMDELDRIKKTLEKHRNKDILVISPEGQIYRDGASKEQMLKCRIDQISGV